MPGAGLGGILTASASRHQARQANLAKREDVLAGFDGLDGNQWDGGEAIDMPPELLAGHPVIGCAPPPRSVG
jgi:hypothetical protein